MWSQKNFKKLSVNPCLYMYSSSLNCNFFQIIAVLTFVVSDLKCKEERVKRKKLFCCGEMKIIMNNLSHNWLKYRFFVASWTQSHRPIKQKIFEAVAGSETDAITNLKRYKVHVTQSEISQRIISSAMQGECKIGGWSSCKATLVWQEKSMQPSRKVADSAATGCRKAEGFGGGCSGRAAAAVAVPAAAELKRRRGATPPPPTPPLVRPNLCLCEADRPRLRWVWRCARCTRGANVHTHGQDQPALRWWLRQFSSRPNPSSAAAPTKSRSASCAPWVDFC